MTWKSPIKVVNVLEFTEPRRTRLSSQSNDDCNRNLNNAESQYDDQYGWDVVYEIDKSRLRELTEDQKVPGTILVKMNGKVIAHCEIDLLWESRVYICTYYINLWGLRIVKCRRPHLLNKLTNKPETKTSYLKKESDFYDLEDWPFRDWIQEDPDELYLAFWRQEHFL